ncbi:hypothetical protein PPL_11450 [Heterostelium album PN500]|uniref:Uncharacterized protein n=1 Tax=Heterostelium pallidum (strain ATCC 26659 / Pp 5 / PN500) TaxID=670386 RepID=D3BTF6_HETP5|nr:hypothetical protein PPL_11450 [Heterostelium album PN500]EFA75373.1 hypothetical protein PPL_11450 [Heterostelium album PN500]|eukprot:XP_020427507.1 hypothetical protein PPL_11450 [Heterostelium album PN500]
MNKNNETDTQDIKRSLKELDNNLFQPTLNIPTYTEMGANAEQNNILYYIEFDQELDNYERLFGSGMTLQKYLNLEPEEQIKYLSSIFKLSLENEFKKKENDIFISSNTP